MNNKLKITLLAVLISLSWCALHAQTTAKEPAKTLEIGQEAPDFTLADNKGDSLCLSSLRGQYVVLDFWGTWCKWCISGMPKMNFGLSAHLEYKGFDLSISTYGALGYHVSDHIYNALNSCYGYGNKDVNMANANRWAEDGSYLADVPRTFTTVTHPGGTLAWNDLFSDRQIQNAAYWKIANVELGYNIPNSLFGGYITGARIYVSAQNLHTFTGYKGYNVDYAPGVFTPGYNYCSYPSARSFMCGVNFSF